jgi:hypothetical protein
MKDYLTYSKVWYPSDDVVKADFEKKQAIE